MGLMDKYLVCSCPHQRKSLFSQGAYGVPLTSALNTSSPAVGNAYNVPSNAPVTTEAGEVSGCIYSTPGSVAETAVTDVPLTANPLYGKG